MSKFFPTSGLIWKDPTEFDLKKYTSNNSKGCVLEVDLEYLKQLLELHNNYPLATEMLANYQLKIADVYNILTHNVKTLVPNFFDKETYVVHYENLQLYLRLGLKLKKSIAY